MKPYQERVVAEKKELDEKIVKLKAFLDDPEKFDEADAGEQDCLLEQVEIMQQYSDILGDRIAIFEAIAEEEEE